MYLLTTMTLIWTWIYNLPPCHCEYHPGPELEQFLDPVVSLALDFHDGSTLMQLPRLPVYVDTNPNQDQRQHWAHVQVFRVGRETRHCFILWELYEKILMDIAAVLRISKHDVVELHDVRPDVKLHGVGPDTSVVILQQAGDLLLTDPRVLVIWEVQVHKAAALFTGPDVRQAALRTEKRLSRHDIWKQSQTPQCERTLPMSPCIVLVNGVPTDVGGLVPVLYVSHGDVIVIHVPPEAMCESDTESYDI